MFRPPGEEVSASLRRSNRFPRTTLTSVAFLLILSCGAYVRFQGITKVGIACCDSADIWWRADARLQKQVLPGNRFMPIPDYLYSAAMNLVGRKDYVTLVVNSGFDTLNIALMFFLVQFVTSSRLCGIAGMALYASLPGSISLARDGMTHPIAVFFIILSFLAFLGWYARHSIDGNLHILRLAKSGALAGASLCSHLSTQFFLPAYIIVILIVTLSRLENMRSKCVRFVLLSSVFVASFACVFGVFVVIEEASRPDFEFFDEMQRLSNSRDTGKWVLERHYAPIVDATKMRPTLTSAVADHLALGTQMLTRGSLATGRPYDFWYGDNIYSVLFTLGLPAMAILSRRGRRDFLPGDATYIFSLAYLLGLYLTYTAFYAHHARYVLHIMPFLILNSLYWIPLLIGTWLGLFWKDVCALGIAVIGVVTQIQSIDLHALVRRQAETRAIADAIGDSLKPGETILIADPAIGFGTGQLGWTMERVYFRSGQILPFPPADRAYAMIAFLRDHNVRYVLADGDGIAGLINNRTVIPNIQAAKAFGRYLKEIGLEEICSPCGESLPTMMYRIGESGPLNSDFHTYREIDYDSFGQELTWLPWPRNTEFSVSSTTCPTVLSNPNCVGIEIELAPGAITAYDGIPARQGELLSVAVWLWGSGLISESEGVQIQLQFEDSPIKAQSELISIGTQPTLIEMEIRSTSPSTSGSISIVNRSIATVKFRASIESYMRK